jgi:stearoyl-CoA desaturase (delta-9 desaturase)
MFAITGFYHRYFSHRTFKTSRAVQLFFALLGSMSVQRGPLWWAAHHRWHHANSDTELDVHSPNARDFVWSHLGWIASTKNMVTDYQRVTDFAEFPELRFVNRFDWMMPAVLLIALYATGEWLRLSHPNLGTSGPQLVVWGFFISTTLLLNATACINSLAHMFGSRRYNTPDGSRNNPLLALVTFGEGWHNNHHKYSHCARQGFAWWEIDLTYYGLRLLEFFGLVWDLKPVPKNALQETDIVNNRRIEVKAR